MKSRGPMFNDGRFALLVLAASLLPVAIKRSKPLARYIGDRFVELGEHLRKGTEPDPASPKETVDQGHKTETSKVGHSAADVAVTSASPPAQEELEQNAVAEQMAAGDGASTEPVKPKPRPSRKKQEPNQPLNPKRTRNSRAE